jgi:glycosyltransferase
LITASYNSAATIADTLRSVRGQSWRNIEHIVVDGASKDDTLKIVEREGAHLERVVSEPDKGIYDAYNKGLKLVSGDIIGFINSDDFYASPTVIEEVVAAFADPAVEAVHADLVYVDQQNTAKVLRYWRARDCTAKNLARGFVPAHPTLFLRRSVYEREGGFDTRFRLAADYEFMLRILHDKPIRSVRLPRIWVRMRAGGASGGSLGSIKRQNAEIRRAQTLHGVRYAALGFFFHKVADRAMQRLRARWVDAPTMQLT